MLDVVLFFILFLVDARTNAFARRGFSIFVQPLYSTIECISLLYCQCQCALVQIRNTKMEHFCGHFWRTFLAFLYKRTNA
uniref:Secreted protein n=1 Tax=Steinernema glaseri TaxID=37863 RepID=A0A1I7Z0S0_9BILA